LLIVRPAILDGDVFAFNESSVVQALPKGIDNICEARSRGASEKSDYWHCRLLRARRERPQDRRTADKQRDEVAPPQIESHLISHPPGPDCRISNWQWSVSEHSRISQPLLVLPTRGATARYTFGTTNAQIEGCSRPRPRHTWQCWS
jgi:hypothetical protein